MNCLALTISFLAIAISGAILIVSWYYNHKGLESVEKSLSNKPCVCVYFMQEENKSLHLIVRNVGSLPASNICISFSPSELEYDPEKGRGRDKEWERAANNFVHALMEGKLKILLPDEEERCALGSLSWFSMTDYELTIYYENPITGDSYKYGYRLNPEMSKRSLGLYPRK